MTSTPTLHDGALASRPNEGRSYVTYNSHNFRNIPQMAKLTEDERFAIEVVAQVLPFKVNNYVRGGVNQLGRRSE